MTLLRIVGLGKAFGGVAALADVSFDVAPGETLGLMGANGAGKTTLFALVAGGLKPDRGRILLDGRRIDGLGADRVNRLGIARTFQIVRPFAGMTVLENVAAGALYGARPERSVDRANERARAILDTVGLSDRAAAPANSLTLAGRKRLEVARALATEPRLLLLDEVMAGLTASEVAEALGIIRHIRDRTGVTLIVIEHVMKALMRLSDRIVVLHHGRKVSEGTPEAVSRDAAVIEAYFGGRRVDDDA